MPKFTNANDANRHANQLHGSVRDLKPFTDDATGHLIGWTFRVPSASLRHGWVLTDGRVSPATETYRDEAEDYGRRTWEADQPKAAPARPKSATTPARGPRVQWRLRDASGWGDWEDVEPSQYDVSDCSSVEFRVVKEG